MKERRGKKEKRTVLHEKTAKKKRQSVDSGIKIDETLKEGGIHLSGIKLSQSLILSERVESALAFGSGNSTDAPGSGLCVWFALSLSLFFSQLLFNLSFSFSRFLSCSLLV